MSENIENWKKLSEQHPAVEKGGDKLKDNVNNPEHYNQGGIECIAYLEDNLGEGYDYYLEGNVKKYLHRWRYKGESKDKKIEDLRKAAWYLGKLIESQVFGKH